MGKCYPIIHFLDFGGISHLYSQPNRLMARAIKKVSHGSHQSPQSHFAVPTMEGMALGPLPVRSLASLAAQRADAQKYTLHCRGRGSLRLFGRGNDDVWYGQAARGAASRSPRRPRQGARPKPGVLTIKAGMWFCFKGIVLATPPSIKDSDGDPREGAAGPHPLERGAAAPHGVRLGPVAEGVETKAGKCKKTGG
jgi:hypothetical protein